jgi:hypothetical protein
MGKGRLTRKDDPEDQRRVDEAEEAFMPRSLKTYTSYPNVKQLRNHEPAIFDDGTTRELVVRIGNTLYKSTLTAV